MVVVDDLHGNLANLTEARRRGGVRFHRMDVAQGGLATLADRVRADALGPPGHHDRPRPGWEDPTTEARAVAGRDRAVAGGRPPGPGARLLRCLPLPGPAHRGHQGRRQSPGRCTPMSRLAMEAYAGAFSARASRSPRWSSARSTGRDRTRSRPGLVARAAWTMLQNQPPRVDGDGRQERDCSWTTPSTPSPGPSTPPRPPGGCWSAPARPPGSSRNTAGRPDRLGRRAEWAPARPGDPRRSALDPAAAGKALNWQPWTRLEEGLGLTVDWLKARLPGHHRHMRRPFPMIGRVGGSFRAETAQPGYGGRSGQS